MWTPRDLGKEDNKGLRDLGNGLESLILDMGWWWGLKSQSQNEAFHRPAVRCQRPRLWWVPTAPGVSVLLALGT